MNNLATRLSRLTRRRQDVALEGSPANPSVVDQNARTSFRALLIGVDEYLSPQIRNLRGAAADVARVKEFLVSELSVSADSITTLVNAEATRRRIVEALEELSSPTNGLVKDDPIFIYYAGVGGAILGPNEFQFRALVPHDASTSGGTDDIDIIPEYTLVDILRKVAHVKGNNITLVLDCGHCGHSWHGLKYPRVANVVRRDVPAATSWYHAERLSEGEHAYPDSLPHVLLAACGRTYNQVTYESEIGGFFTGALLAFWRTHAIEELTYASTIHEVHQMLPAPMKRMQLPACEGRQGETQKLFNSRITRTASQTSTTNLNDESEARP